MTLTPDTVIVYLELLNPPFESLGLQFDLLLLATDFAIPPTHVDRVKCP